DRGPRGPRRSDEARGSPGSSRRPVRAIPASRIFVPGVQLRTRSAFASPAPWSSNVGMSETEGAADIGSADTQKIKPVAVEAAPPPGPSPLEGFTPEKLRELHRALLLPRVIEEKMLLLLRQGKLSKWFSGVGQEAIAVGVTSVLE